MGTNQQRLAAELNRDRLPQGTPVSWVEPATVAAVTPGGASDGNASCTVTWRSGTYPAAYAASYAPAVGDVVLVLIQPPAGLVVLCRVIGTP